MGSSIADTRSVEPKSEMANEVEEQNLEYLNLEKTQSTVDNVYIHNELAYKGDDSDGIVQWSVRGVISATCLCFLYTGCQMIVYFVGGPLSYIAADLKAPAAASWLPVTNTLANAAAAPFAGYLQDLLGRRYISLAALCCVIIGCVLVGSSHSMAQAIAGMAVTGAGAGVCELTALAGLSDLVPVKHRGYILAGMTIAIYPLSPYILYTQLLATRASWRWGLWIVAIWNGILLAGLTLTYFPHNHTRMEGFSGRKILARIDYVGAILSITGITIFLVALQSGGGSHPWKSAYVLCQLLIGAALLVIWLVWEAKFAQFPMLPFSIFRGQRIVALTFITVFIAGAQFYSLVNFFPVAFSAMFPPDPIQTGLGGLGFALGGTTGSAIINAILSTKKIEANVLLVVPLVIMTAFTGALASTSPDTPTMIAVLGTFAGLGTGAVLIPATTIAIFVVPDSLLATTAAWSFSIRVIGGSVGYTIYYNIFSEKLTKFLPEQVAKYAIAAGLSPADATEFVTMFLTTPLNITSAPGYTPEVAQAAAIGTRWGNAEALKYVWYTTIPFGVLAIITCLFLPSVKKYQTARIAIRLE